LVGKSHTRRQLGKPRNRREGNIKMNLTGLDSSVSGYGQAGGSFEDGNAHFGFIKCREFRNMLSTHSLLERDCELCCTWCINYEVRHVWTDGRKESGTNKAMSLFIVHGGLGWLAMETYELQSALLSLTIRLVSLERSVYTVRYTQEMEKLPPENTANCLAAWMMTQVTQLSGFGSLMLHTVLTACWLLHLTKLLNSVEPEINTVCGAWWCLRFLGKTNTKFCK